MKGEAATDPGSERSGRSGVRRWILWVVGIGGVGLLLFFAFGGPERIREIRVSMERQELLPRLNRLFPEGDNQSGSNEEAMRNRISNSSAIAFTEGRSRDGGTGQVIVEIFKLVNDVECFYEVGDVIGEIKRGGRGEISPRMIHFFQGNPAAPRGSMSIHAGLILKQRDLRESAVRKWITEIVAEGRSVDSIAVSQFDMKYPSPSFDELLESADVIVFAENRIENGMVQGYVKEVFQVNRDVPVSVAPGDRLDSGHPVEANVLYGEGFLKFYGEFNYSKEKQSTVVRGRLIMDGDMPIEIALGRIRKEVEARKRLRLEKVGDE